MSRPGPHLEFPKEFLEHDQGIGAYFNPEEGLEFMLGFNHVLSGFKKKGQKLTEDEQAAIQQFIGSHVISPSFVRRLANEHGAESVAEAYLIRDQSPEVAMDYLIRAHKGRFYRKRYPSLSFTGTPEKSLTL